MAPVFDPFHPLYFDDADLRGELDRVHAICGGCRACVELCDSFPRLFDLLDGAAQEQSRPLTRSEQDHVVEGCFECGLCVLGCPDSPVRSGRAVDVPRLMARARQLRRIQSPPGSGERAVVGARRVVAGLLGPRRRTRFSSWMAQRAPVDPPVGAPVDGDRSGADSQVAIFPTCHVEHRDQALGRAMVGVLERSGLRCALPDGLVCCGAPQLAQGDIAGFVELGRRNVRVLADAVRAGNDIVVPLPSCASVLRDEYVAFVGGSDAELVAAHTTDASEHLLARIRRGDAPELIPSREAGDTDRAVTMHVPCRVRTQHDEVPGAELLRLAGFAVTVVAGCASPDRRAPDALRRDTAGLIGDSGTERFVGECPDSVGEIASVTGAEGLHPLQLLARTYGLAD